VAQATGAHAAAAAADPCVALPPALQSPVAPTQALLAAETSACPAPSTQGARCGSKTCVSMQWRESLLRGRCWGGTELN